ncbi:hypothetical protein SETIT_9G140900v2 [Setaria italica]|uniref:Uncharacterized protein n=1 Tax=Setaria italica TaxID=4555 RepID=A0A368SGL1_SETIT|nr:hypothetical protein SETIT_9G140900v2 [Setaria italica]
MHRTDRALSPLAILPLGARNGPQKLLLASPFLNLGELRRLFSSPSARLLLCRQLFDCSFVCGRCVQFACSVALASLADALYVLDGLPMKTEKCIR